MNLLAKAASDVGLDHPATLVGWALFIVTGVVYIVREFFSDRDKDRSTTIDDLSKTVESLRTRLGLVEDELKEERRARVEAVADRGRLEGELKALKDAGISDHLGQQLLDELRHLNKQLAEYHAKNQGDVAELKTMVAASLNLEIQDIHEGKPPARTRRRTNPSS